LRENKTEVGEMMKKGRDIVTNRRGGGGRRRKQKSKQ